MSRDDDRGGRDRDRSSRDDRAGGRDRDRGDSRDTRDTRSSSRDDGGRDRDRDRGRDEGRDRGRDDSRDRGRDSGRGGYVYEKRDDAETARRATVNSKFDKYINADIKTYKPRDGGNHLRILPPTWPKAKHYGYDLNVHYGVGADRQTYLCLQKMADDADRYFERMKIDARGGKDPVEEEAQQLRRDGYDKEAKEASQTPRVGVYVIDRKAESEGVQFWAMPVTADREIVQHSINKRTGAVLSIDDPEDGYDIFFDKNGKDLNTKYTGWDVDRDPSPLGNKRWLDWAMEHPIPDQLMFYPYDHIATMLGGGGGHSNKRDSDDDRSRDRDRDDRGSSRSSRDEPDRSDRAGRDAEADSGRRERTADRDVGRRSGGDDEPTWASIHAMRPRELEDLIEDKRLDINPKEAKDDEDLADWVCDELRISKPELQRRSIAETPGDDRADKLERMRRERN